MSAAAPRLVRRPLLALLAAAALTLVWIAVAGSPPAQAAAPVCSGNSHTVESGRPLNLNANCTDSDGPSALTFSVVDWPDHGSLSGDPSTGTATYRSLSGYIGPDSFTFRAFDGAEYSNIATVNIEVVAQSGDNSPPECPEANVFVPEGGSVTVLANCKDADGDAISYAFAPPNPTGGTASGICCPIGATYTPNPGTTQDSFGYSASDGINPPVITVVPITVVPPGPGTVETAPDTTPTSPAAVSITTTAAGPVSVDTRAVTSTPPTGFFLLGQEFDIEAPDAPDADHPLRFVFEFDATVPAGALTVFRDGQPVTNCTGAPSAVPDPCVESVTTDADGDKLIAVLTTHASLWNFGIRSTPASADDCKNGGWKTFSSPAFRSQGDCVSFVATGGKNPPRG